ncbi:MAG: hypothetical protein N3A69_03940 [Leptospiraceae bacterium]|nr:hypothetical protein [Leptospiraceae bacterium]
MLILRLASYLIVLILTSEVLALSAVVWSFYESVNSSLSLLKYTSDNKARDILSTISRVAETKAASGDISEMNEFFQKLIKQSEKDLDKFLIKEIFLVAKDGTLLAHSNPEELRNSFVGSYNKPQYMRALRMRKGQLPTPQVIGEEYKGDQTFFGSWITKTFPDLRFQTILLSAPVYHTQRLEVIATIHLIYNRGNVLFFIESQRELLQWMLSNYTIIALVLAFGLWTVFMLYTFASYRQGARVASGTEKPKTSSKSTSKIMSIIEKKEESLQKYLSPMPAHLDSDVSLNIMELETSPSTEPQLEPVELDDTIPPFQNNGRDSKNPKEMKKTEAIDAIYLD